MQHHRKINSPVSLLKAADAPAEYEVDHYGEKSFWGDNGQQDRILANLFRARETRN